MHVASSFNTEAIKYIVEYTKQKLNLDVKDYINYKNEYGQTALRLFDFNKSNMDEKESDRREVVNLLKSYGAQ